MTDHTAEPAAEWTTNATLEQIADRLRETASCVVLTHTKPDGDALGSTVAVLRALVHKHNAATTGAARPFEAWYTGSMPLWAKSITADAPHRVLSPTDKPPATNPDTVLILDTGSWSQLEPFAEWLKPRADKCVIIDHHLSGNAEIAAHRHIDTTAAAACQPAAELCRRILGIDRISDLPADIATPLYLGLATDTGWFKHSNVTPAVMRLAADLIEAGVKHAPLFELIEQTDRPARLAIMARALASLELHRDSSISLMSLTSKDFSETSAGPEDTGGLIDLPKSVAAVRVSALLTEVEPNSPDGPKTKVSLRSKGGPDMIDVNKVCRSLGGGGHAQAAGARIPLPLDQAKVKLLAAILEAITS